MALIRINFVKGPLMKEFKDGQVMLAGTELKALKGIAFAAATAPTKKGEKLMVVIRLDLANQTSQSSVHVSMSATEFHKIAELFQARSDQLKANTTPKAPLQ